MKVSKKATETFTPTTLKIKFKTVREQELFKVMMGANIAIPHALQKRGYIYSESMDDLAEMMQKIFYKI